MFGSVLTQICLLSTISCQNTPCKMICEVILVHFSIFISHFLIYIKPDIVRLHT